MESTNEVTTTSQEKDNNTEISAFEETEDDPLIGKFKNVRREGSEQPSNNEEASE